MMGHLIHQIQYGLLFCLLLSLLSACTTQPLTLRYGEISSQAMNKSMPYAVYTPPNWSTEEQLPLVVLLHGGGGSHKNFDRANTEKYLDAEILAGRAPRAVIAIPYGELGFWENWHDGSRRYRDWVVRELIPTVQQDYHTAPCPQACHIAGISMGAHGALRFALFEHKYFASIAVISGRILDVEDTEAFFNTFMMKYIVPTEKIWGALDEQKLVEENPFYVWVHNKDVRNLRLLLAWGREDYPEIIRTSEKFHHHLLKEKVAHRQWVFDGGHKWKAWAAIFPEILRFHIQSFHLQE